MFELLLPDSTGIAAELPVDDAAVLDAALAEPPWLPLSLLPLLVSATLDVVSLVSEGEAVVKVELLPPVLAGSPPVALGLVEMPAVGLADDSPTGLVDKLPVEPVAVLPALPEVSAVPPLGALEEASAGSVFEPPLGALEEASAGSVLGLLVASAEAPLEVLWL